MTIEFKLSSNVPNLEEHILRTQVHEWALNHKLPVHFERKGMTVHLDFKQDKHETLFQLSWDGQPYRRVIVLEAPGIGPKTPIL